ncbi:Chloramphenicol acetyltransferase [Streptococcus agalactiae]|nr:Chloramphenicol acetyltransferase [Streptococcus agalactiae]EJZ03539.1 chloramphenicol acetyltransferase [Streptococcus agalactiae STIR-CD-17]EPU01510.1 chloramphenicol acetyltransferase [Streptococcus agalactiae STIR-CD-09]EPU02677.1 chloramphenicol acetyltransferase [Streptococcus agalactiae STIR-CD-13]EPW83119.1 chloramphenicol acetyltransferase [Streptococcus agalactiae STIR-CD-07]
MSTGASYPKYGFSVGKYTYGYQQFFYEGVNLKEIGAGSVITKDIPDYAVVAGTPAKIIKYRFSEEEITLLNASQWWNWSDEAIKEHISEFSDKKEFFNTLKSIEENKNHKL